MSAFTRAVISSGVLPRMINHSGCAFCCTPGIGRTSLMALVRAWITGCGVLAGAEIPFQLTISYR